MAKPQEPKEEQPTKPPATGKGKAFFERADEVAATGNWDFAIELYVEGLRREPDNIDRGHKPLRDVAMKRKAQGGKNPGWREQFKHRPGKDPVENLANAAYLLAKQPGSVKYMQQFLKAAQSLELNDVAKWICDVLLDSQRQAGKPNMAILMLLIQSYHDLEEFALAIRACELARGIDPNNPKLYDAMNELSAKYTLKKGKYGQEGDFTKGVADLEKQKGLMKDDALVKDKDFLLQQVEHARAEYLESPNIPGKINVLVDALCKLEDEAYENEAVDVLKKAHADSAAYQFKLRIGDIKIRQLTRRYRALMAAGDTAAAAKHAGEQLKFEMVDYAERVANYPTDLPLKYELGRRQFLAKQYDDAIASLQQAQRDPRRHVSAMSYLGQAFARKEWYREASDTFERVLQSEMSEENRKDLLYNHGDALEKMGDFKKAQDQFSEVAQLDFTYKDVRDRLENIRKKLDAEEQ